MNKTTPCPEIESAIEAWLDAQARALGYASMDRAATYAASTHPVFGAEGRALVACRDAAWVDYFSLLVAVAEGTRKLPAPDKFVLTLQLPDTLGPGPVGPAP